MLRQNYSKTLVDSILFDNAYHFLFLFNGKYDMIKKQITRRGKNLEL